MKNSTTSVFYIGNFLLPDGNAACQRVFSNAKLMNSIGMKSHVISNNYNYFCELREYEGVKQRKFTSKFDVPVLNPDGSAFSGRVTRGSKVRLLYSDGAAHPVHGTPTYLNKVKVLEVAEVEGAEDF